jgi:CHASE1-domain containing sensor protein
MREVVVPASTSFRISGDARTRLAMCAAREGTTATALLEQLIVEGIDQRTFPGIVFRGPAHNRRAALAGGPDVWEVVGRLKELDGSEEHRISALSEESALHPRLIRLALDYASEHPDDVVARIERNRAMAEASQRAVRQRASLLA